jgi:FkbM family methyltransferase
MRQKLILAISPLVVALIKRILGSHLYALIAKTDNGLFAVDPEDFGVSRLLLKEGRYGFDELSRLERYITPDSRVLIVGAHIGSLVIPISKLCKKVVAIEANPTTYDLLTINLALNNVSNCEAINIAANDKNERIDFLLNRTVSGGSKRVPVYKDPIYYSDNPKKVSINAVRLDDYLEEKHFDLVLMDIEGSEYFALRGMQQILEKSRVLAVEFVPHHLKNVSGVTVEQFISEIEPHFSTLTIPSKQLKVDASDFVGTLNDMYKRGLQEESIIFER